jgi:hypothetical protein
MKNIMGVDKSGKRSGQQYLKFSVFYHHLVGFGFILLIK